MSMSEYVGMGVGLIYPGISMGWVTGCWYYNRAMWFGFVVQVVGTSIGFIPHIYRFIPFFYEGVMRGF